ncbi:hypothetical protein [Streptomyces regalis]|uniref:Uncharacterized protein n=1 Tax=Streptomyces regalis TaxID=68262 RepID=A0A101JCV0_9ACTN|nr:hypothetical protein [Streptomyces regalis]KUL24441.1 hypothetical protein ADL12_37015 [Streptomyces regalis]
MIQQVEHGTTGVGAADIALALEIAGALHAPTAPSRAPELATTGLNAGRRAAAARGRRRTVRG